jgi:hypothetical protein
MHQSSPFPFAFPRLNALQAAVRHSNTSGEHFVIVAHPHDAYGYAGVDKNDNVESVKRLTYIEAAYSDISRGLMAKSN